MARSSGVIRSSMAGTRVKSKGPPISSAPAPNASTTAAAVSSPAASSSAAQDIAQAQQLTASIPSDRLGIALRTLLSSGLLCNAPPARADSMLSKADLFAEAECGIASGAAGTNSIQLAALAPRYASALKAGNAWLM